MSECNNITAQAHEVTREQRELLQGHRSLVIWFTGLSGAGKSTLAQALAAELHVRGYRTFVLDGDNVRLGLCKDLGFSPEHRGENLRRVAEVVRLFLDAGIIVLGAFISPTIDDREMVRAIVGPDDFVEVYVNCPLAVCEQRDVKGLYRKARTGAIASFTGISAPYDPPPEPDLIVNTSAEDIDACIQRLLSSLPDLPAPRARATHHTN